MTSTPHALNRARFSRIAGFAAISACIAGARRIGTWPPRATEANEVTGVSSIPWAILEIELAVAGAIKSRSACPSHGPISVTCSTWRVSARIGGCPDAKVSASSVMIFSASALATTRTSAPCPDDLPDDPRDLYRSDRSGDADDDAAALQQLGLRPPDRLTGMHRGPNFPKKESLSHYLTAERGASPKELSNVRGKLAPPVGKKPARRTARKVSGPTADAPPEPLPMAGTTTPSLSTSQFAELSHPVIRDQPIVLPSTIERGLVAFDLDGTILDDIGLIADVAADVLFRAFGTPPEEGRHHYLATTGMPFEAQLSQLYPEAPAQLRDQTARIFHQRKVTEAYTIAGIFPEVPKLLKRLSSDGWTLVVSTGSEREMAELMLEREGLGYWFEGVLGSAQGTKREHLTEFQRRYPGAAIFLVGDSRFDMEAADRPRGRGDRASLEPPRLDAHPGRPQAMGGRLVRLFSGRASRRSWKRAGTAHPKGRSTPTERGRAGTETLWGRGLAPSPFEPGSRDPQSPRIGQTTPSRPQDADASGE